MKLKVEVGCERRGFGVDWPGTTSPTSSAFEDSVLFGIDRTLYAV